MNWFEKTVSAICYTISYHHDESVYSTLELPNRRPYNDVVNFVLEEIRAMTDYLRWGVLILTLLLSLSTFLRTRSLFHQLHPKLREIQMKSWKNNKLDFIKNLIFLYESLAVLAFYSKHFKPQEESMK